MRIEIAEHPAAAVKVEQGGGIPRWCAGATIDAQIDWTVRAIDLPVLYRGDRLSGPLNRGKAGIVVAARSLRRAIFECARLRSPAKIEKPSGAFIKLFGHISSPWLRLGEETARFVFAEQRRLGKIAGYPDGLSTFS